MNCWYTEDQTPDLRLGFRITDIVHQERTPYQELVVVDTLEYGRMLVLDGMVQTTVKDEFVYHEMIAHVAMATHPDPGVVAVLGGGDGGTVREVLKHPSVARVDLVEIDRAVVEASRRFLPEISCGLSDPRVRIIVEDAAEHVRVCGEQYDVMLVDSTEPVGAAEALFSGAFYRDAARALASSGMIVCQSESPFVNAGLLRRTWESISSTFPISRVYLAAVPTYPSGLWSFTLGSRGPDPEQFDPQRASSLGTRYYTPSVHRASLALPAFVSDLLEGNGPGDHSPR